MERRQHCGIDWHSPLGYNRVLGNNLAFFKYKTSLKYFTIAI